MINVRYLIRNWRKVLKENKVLKEELSLFFSNLYLPFFLALTDLKARYRRSFLGPFWNVLTVAIGVLGLSLIWSEIFNVPKSEMVPSLCIGLVFWNFISACVVEASSTFFLNTIFLKNVKISTFTLSLTMFYKHFLNLLHGFFLITFVLVYFHETLSLTTLLFIPGIVLVTLNLLWIIHVLSYLGARYRDLSPLIASIMPIVFFLTPVLYQARQLKSMKTLMIFNPFFHFISLVRDPLLGGLPSVSNYAVSLCLLIFGWIFAFYLTEKKRYRLMYWI